MYEKELLTSGKERGGSMYTVYDIANWFLSNLEKVTNKKLQKLVYYAYSWYLVFNNESADNIEWRFFENKFEEKSYQTFVNKFSYLENKEEQEKKVAQLVNATFRAKMNAEFFKEMNRSLTKIVEEYLK